MNIKISVNLALSCPSNIIPLFMSNSGDQDTAANDNESQRDGFEAK